MVDKNGREILERIGNTPILKLTRESIGVEQNIYVKPEFLNPSGSIKDRIALYMIRDAEKKGLLKPGGMIVEASTGNTAIALSFVGTVMGYRVKIFLPREVGEDEKVNTMKYYGAQVEMLDTGYKEMASDDSVHGSSIEILPRQKCLEAEQNDPLVWWARQFSNANNSKAHRETTGQEIINQTGGNLDAFVASVGTAGTLLGVGQALKEFNSQIKIVGVEPSGFPAMRNGKEGIEIIEGITGGLILDAIDISDDLVVVDNDQAVKMSDRLVLEEGLFCGISSGANVFAAIRYAESHPEIKNIVTVLPDRRDRYYTVQRYTT